MSNESEFDLSRIPHDTEAERSVLGSLLISPLMLGEILGFLTSRDFFHPKHQAIFDIAIDLHGRGFPVDAITVCSELDTHGTFTAGADRIFVLALIHDVPTSSGGMYYANIVAEKAELRRLVEAGTRIAQLAREGSDPQAALSTAQGHLDDIGCRRSNAEIVHISETFQDAIEETEAAQNDTGIQGLSTGIMDLDEILSGLRPGQMVIIAGRPAVGKSTLGVNILQHVTIRQNIPGIMFSLEMNRIELVTRIISAECGVLLNRLRDGSMEARDWEKIDKHASKIVKAPLYIDDTPTVTPTEIRARARKLINKKNLGLIVIDYMQLMVSGKKVENRQQEVSNFSREMKIMAKELQVPVVVLSQLNRGSEQRTDKTPMLSDLRESGSLEQDADIVVLLHRPDLYEKESPRAGECDLIVAKNRNGPSGVVTTAARLHYSCFVDIQQDPLN